MDAQEPRHVPCRALEHVVRERARGPKGVVLRVHVAAQGAVHRELVVLVEGVQPDLVHSRERRVPARRVVHVAQLDREAVPQRVRVHAAVVDDLERVRVLEHGAQEFHHGVRRRAPEHVEDKRARARRQLYEAHGAKAPEVDALDVERQGLAAAT